MSFNRFNGAPLSFYPKTAVRFGLNEAIILYQLYNQEIYRVSTESAKTIQLDGYDWFLCSFTDWARLLCFIPEPTIKKNILGLEKLGVVVSCEPNKHKGDRTKAYRININLYEKLMSEVK